MPAFWRLIRYQDEKHDGCACVLKSPSDLLRRKVLSHLRFQACDPRWKPQARCGEGRRGYRYHRHTHLNDFDALANCPAMRQNSANPPNLLTNEAGSALPPLGPTSASSPIPQYCGICHSDVHFIDGDMGVDNWPMVSYGGE